MNKYRE